VFFVYATMGAICNFAVLGKSSIKTATQKSVSDFGFQYLYFSSSWCRAIQLPWVLAVRLEKKCNCVSYSAFTGDPV